MAHSQEKECNTMRSFYLYIALIVGICVGSFNTTYAACDNEIFDFVSIGNIIQGCASNGFSVQFSNQSTLNGGNATYVWDFGDGTTSNEENPIHVYDSVGIFTVKLVVNSKIGDCIDSVIKQDFILSGKDPIADFKLLSTEEGCTPHEVCFENTSTLGDVGISSFLWDYGNGQIFTEENPCGFYTQSVNALVKFSITDSLGCTSNAEKRFQFDVTKSRPSIYYSIDKPLGCFANHKVTISDSSVGNGPISYIWEFGYDSTSIDSVKNSSYTYPDTGNYDIRVHMTDSLNCYTQLLSYNAVKIRTLTADYAADTLSFCESNTYEFSDLSSIHAISWTYRFGDETSSNSRFISHSYDDTTIYRTSLTVTDDYGCIDSLVKFINVELNVAANFDTTPIKACQDSITIQFVDNSKNAATWLWQFGDGNQSTLQNPTHHYGSQGTYDVSLTVTDTFGCSHTMTVENKVTLENYTADFSINDYPYCTPAKIFSDVTSLTPHSWSWSIDSAEFNTQNTSFTFREAGKYNIQLIVKGAYCSDTIDSTYNVATPPVLYADFYADTVFSCDSVFTVNFRDTSFNAESYLWNFGDGNKSFDENPTHTYQNPGYFDVSLIITDTGGCVDQKLVKRMIEVRRPFEYFPPTFDCDSSLVMNFFNPDTNANYWKWSLGNGEFIMQADSVYTYPAKGYYQTYFQIADTNTSCFSTFNDTVKAGGLNSMLNMDSIVCYGDSLLFTVTADYPTEVLWNFGDGSNDTLLSPYHIYESTGKYDLTLVIKDEHCQDSIFKPEFIEVLPPVAHFGSKLNCDNPLKVTFRDSSESAISYLWDFGDGSTDDSPNPIHTFNTNGQYIVSLTTSNNNCSNITIDTLAIEVMQINFGFDTIVCYGDSIPFTDSSVAAQEYLWDFGDGNISTRQNPKHLYDLPDSYNVSLITTSNKICKDTLERQITVNQPKSVYDIRRTCNTPKRITFINHSLGADSISWNFGDGSPEVSDSLTAHTYVNTGDYILTFTSFNFTTGCSHQITDTILVSVVQPNFSVSKSVVCFDEEVQFIDESDFAKEWYWKFDPSRNDTSIEQNPYYAFQELGHHDVKLIATDTFGCSDSITITDVVEVHGPKTKFEDTHDCIDFYKVSFVDSTEEADAYFWDFGNGITSTEQEPVYTYNSLGVYNVSLTTVNNANGCSHTFTKPVYIFIPKAEFSSNATTTCEDTKVEFTDISIYTQESAWTFGDGTNGLHKTILKAFSTQGEYDVKLVYTDINGCKDSIEKLDFIKVNSNPTARFVVDTNNSCTPINVSFTNISLSDTTITSFIWNFGDYQQSTEENPTHTYTENPYLWEYPIILKVTNANNCSNLLYASNYMKLGSPVARFTGYKFFCVGEETETINLSNQFGGSILWNYSNGYTTNDNNPKATFDSIGTYDLELIITDTLGCTDTMIDTSRFYISKPIANFYTDDDTSKYCPNLLVNFKDVSSDIIDTYEWDFGDDSGLGLGEDVAHLYNEVGEFDVKLIVTTPGGCKDSITKTAFIRITGPSADLTTVDDQPYGCKPLGVEFELSNIIDVDSFFINYADGTPFDTIMSHTYTGIGDYVPELWVVQFLDNGESCTYQIESEDTIKTAKVRASYTLQSASEGCPPFTAIFNNSSDYATSLEWSFGDGNSSTENNPTNIYEESGDYDLELIATDTDGCTDTLFVVKAIDAWDINADFTSSVSRGCSPFVITFIDSSSSEVNIDSWEWDFGNDSIINSPLPQTIIYEWDVNRSFFPSLTITDRNGCIKTHKDTINLFTYPEVDFEPDTNIVCPNTPVDFNLLGSFNQLNKYAYYFIESDSTDSSANTTYSFQEPGYHDLHLTITNQHGCDSTRILEDGIHVLDYPVIELDQGDVIGQGQSTTLFASGVETYSWEPREFIQFPDSNAPIVTPTDTTVFIVTGVDEYNCIVQDSATIIVRKSENNAILFPGAFSPNGDLNNDELRFVNFQIEELSHFTIYNQWGQVVFETNDIEKGWDGTHDGEPQPIGTYAYLVAGIDKKGNELQLKGTFSLIR